MSVEYGPIPHEAAAEAEPRTNLQRLLRHLLADSLAAKLALAREAGSEDGLREVFDARLDELRNAYDTAANQEN